MFSTELRIVVQGCSGSIVIDIDHFQLMQLESGSRLPVTRCGLGVTIAENVAGIKELLISKMRFLTLEIAVPGF